MRKDENTQRKKVKVEFFELIQKGFSRTNRSHRNEEYAQEEEKEQQQRRRPPLLRLLLVVIEG